MPKCSRLLPLALLLLGDRALAGGEEEGEVDSTYELYTYSEVDSPNPPMSPPFLPPAPPAPPLPQVPPGSPPLSPGLSIAEVVSVSVTLEGTVNDFDADVQLAFRQELASAIGLPEKMVRLEVSSASVQVRIDFTPTADISAADLETLLTASAVSTAASAVGATVVSVSAPTTESSIVAPPPPAAPPPAAPPGHLCTDACPLAFNGKCDDNEAIRLAADGGSYTYEDTGETSRRLQEAESCATGTDCTDCGTRSLCTTCGAECRRRGLRLGHTQWCLQSMIGDWMCSAECNNRECGYEDAADGGDCSIDEALTACKPLHYANKGLVSKPANASNATRVIGTNATFASVSMEMQILSFDNPFKVTYGVDESWLVALSFTLQLRWRDSRYMTFPCKDLIPSLIGLEPNQDREERSVKEDEKKNILWFPRLTLDGSALSYKTTESATRFAVKSAKVAFVPGVQTPGLGQGQVLSNLSWLGGSVPSDNGTTCYDCLSYLITVGTTIELERQPGFKYFPFDQQEFGFTLAVADTDLFTCEHALLDLGLGSADNVTALIGNEWIGESISAGHPRAVRLERTASDGIDRSACHIVLKVRRNTMIFVVKQILPTILVVYASLASMYMSAEDHTGDRMAVILVSTLILIVNFQSTLGLGTITYLVWWDIFNLVSLFMLLGVLIAALYEHHLVYSGDGKKARAFNRTIRVAFLVGIYPVVITSLFMYGHSDGRPSLATFAWTFLPCGIIAVLGVSFCAYQWKMLAHYSLRRKMSKILRSLTAVDVDQADFMQTAAGILDAFDDNGDGCLSVEEARAMMISVFGRATLGHQKLSAIMKEAALVANSEDLLTHGAFAEWIVHIMPLLKNDGSGQRKGSCNMNKGSVSQLGTSSIVC